MDKKQPNTRRDRDQFDPEHSRAQKTQKGAILTPHIEQILGENTTMDYSTRKAITLPELAAAIGANPRSMRNAYYLRPQDFPPAVYLPGTRGPRFLVSDVQDWLEDR